MNDFAWLLAVIMVTGFLCSSDEQFAAHHDKIIGRLHSYLVYHLEKRP